MPEYKICPACHTIDPPDAETCECGYRFRSGDDISEEEIARRNRKKRVRSFIGTFILIFLISFLGIMTANYGVKVLLWVLGVAVAAAVLSFIILKIIRAVGGKKGGD